MPLSIPALYRFLGLVAVAVTVPAAVVACSADVTPVTGGTSSPPPSATSPNPARPTTTPTGTGTTAPPPAKDASIDAAKDSGPPPTDVVGSAECTAYCAMMTSKCSRTCVPESDCAIQSGQCAASTRDYLDCQTTHGSWFCGADGFSIVSSCSPNTSRCK